MKEILTATFQFWLDKQGPRQNDSGMDWPRNLGLFLPVQVFAFLQHGNTLIQKSRDKKRNTQEFC